MKPLGETKALEKLRRLQVKFAQNIRENYEQRAKDCATCETPGACCLDAHFVNVRITRLEAVAIRRAIAELGKEKESEIVQRTSDAIRTYQLDTHGFFACPLFEKGIGCLVHDRAKPLPCIAHACYERKEDIPPDHLLTEQEDRVERLNELTYRQKASLLPLPVAIQRSAVGGGDAS